jgi:hypothetical protein
MKKLIKDVGVDAGMIMISDIDHYKKYENDYDIDLNLSQLIRIKPGTYRVNWNINNTWNGDISGSGIVKIESGEMIISDPCYCIHDNNWDKWLEDTNYGKIEPDNSIIIDQMGGDGSYDINLDMVLAEEL